MNSFDEVREVLRDVLQLGPRADKLSRDAALLGGIPEFDSAAVVAVVMALEDRFGFEIADDEINASAFETVGALADFVDGKLAG